jgi:hypothetical protein
MTAPQDPAELNDVLVPTDDADQTPPPPVAPAYSTPPSDGIPDAETE